MARFLNTSATNYYLEELIKRASERLVIISPFLKFNPRMKELLQDRDRLKIDVRIVYGKSELPPSEITWLRSLEFVRTSFCQNLHAKCYLNENSAIITSMNLYQFSLQNNNEMGVFVWKDKEPELYRETYEEVQRLIRISDQVRLSVETIEESEPQSEKQKPEPVKNESKKLSSSKFYRQLNVKNKEEFEELLIRKGFLIRSGEDSVLTDKGKEAGGEHLNSKRFGIYFIWPENLPDLLGT